MRITVPVPTDVWEQVVAEDPGAMPFHTPRWMRCIEGATAWRDATRLYEMPDGRNAVLLMADRGDPSGLVRWQSSWPAGWGAGGIIAPGGVRPHEVASIMRDLAADPAVATFVRPSFAQAPTWAEAARSGRPGPTIRREVHVAALEGTFEDFWSASISKQERSGIRRALKRQEQAEMALTVGNSPRLVRAFYEVYTGWMLWRASVRGVPRDLALWRGRRAEPWRRFEAVSEELGDNCHISVAWLDGRPVGASWLLTQGEMAVSWRGYADRSVPNTLRVSQTLDLKEIELAYDLGCRYLEMGESGGRGSLAAVKRRIGGVAHPFEEYAFERLPLSRARRLYDGSLQALDRHLLRSASRERRRTLR